MENSYDVLIVGAGSAGLCLAKSLAMSGLSVAVIEKQTRDAIAEPVVDGRDIALTPFSRELLEQLGVWQNIPSNSISTIRQLKVFDGVSASFMELSSRRSDQLGFIVPNHQIRTAAYEVVRNCQNITLVNGVVPADLELHTLHAKVILSDGRCLTAKLLIAADSRFSETRKKAGITARRLDFKKTMVVSQMEHSLPHDGGAHECFFYGHTLAILPLNYNRSSIIITMPPLEAQRIKELPAADFNLWVSKQLKYRLGEMRLVGERYAYPLVGMYAEKFISRRFALVGDAAVGMHPVTAHGFNFGLRSQHILSKLLKEALQSGRDIGEEEILSRYQYLHRRATRPLYMVTNMIVGLYTDDSPPAKVARKMLLNAANKMVPVKNYLMDKLIEKDDLSPKFSSPLGIKRKLIQLLS